MKNNYIKLNEMRYFERKLERNRKRMVIAGRKGHKFSLKI